MNGVNSEEINANLNSFACVLNRSNMAHSRTVMDLLGVPFVIEPFFIRAILDPWKSKIAPLKSETALVCFNLALQLD